MITKNKTLASVEIGVETKTINVKWLNQIIEDDVVISSIPHRCAYGILQRDQFRADVENAEQYIIAAGWTDEAYAAAAAEQADIVAAQEALNAQNIVDSITVA